METTFTDHETRFVLGEMLKASTIDVPLLAEFIKAHNVDQNWGHMQLPHGRNMYQCMGAIEKMLPVYFSPPPNSSASLKRKSIGDIGDNPMKRQAMMTPIEPVLPPRIQPRPPSNGYTMPTPSSNSPSLTSTGKKRGRPSKADKEAQARANYSRSMDYPPITPAPAVATMSLAPQREYASSPGYEIASSSLDQQQKNRGIPNASDMSPAGGLYPLASPSKTETPRALPETFEQGDTLSAQDRKPHPPDSRSPLLQPQSQQYQHNQLPHPQPQPPPPPLPAAGRQPPVYEQYKGPDPIFPNRDRSRSAADHIARDTAPTPPVTNRV